MPLAPGTLFAGRFEIERDAGEGGMGRVYRARDIRTDSRVALKVLSKPTGAGPLDERFAREAHILSSLRHPGVVAHVDHGQTPGGQLYLAMEWLDGEDLATRLQRGPLSLHDSLVLLRSLAASLGAAHDNGIIHRDLKPTNVFLVDGLCERAKLLDFGVARDVDATHAITRIGLIVGTPEYMAPEQARGQRDIGPAADIFSLGCVAYECISGHPPFMARHVAAVLVRILFEDPEPLSELQPDIPGPMAQLIDRMLAKDPRERPRTGGELHARLASLDAVPRSGLTPTLVSAPIPRRSEQQLFSVVLAAAPSGRPPGRDSPPTTGAEHQRRASVVAALPSFGVHVDWLLDGTLVVAQATAGSATDQAARAARLALSIQERWPEATVVLATGRGAVHSTTPVGEVVDRATALLQRTRETDGGQRIWLDDVSAGLLERRFAVTRAHGHAHLSGGETSVDESRQLLGKPTPCVGREQELTTLAAVLAGCLDDGEPRAVLVTAPAGAGKSRLRHEFMRRVQAAHPAITVLLGVGDMMGAGAPYSILAAALRRLSGIAGSEPLVDQRARLASRLGQHLAADDAGHTVAFLGELCGVHFPDDHSVKLRAARQDPRVMRDLVCAAFLEWLAAETRAHPVVLVLEDLHWGDAMANHLVDQALRELRSAPWMVLALARPDVHAVFPELWQAHTPVVLPLAGLSKKACERLVQEVLGKDVAADVVHRLHVQSAGNALFLEEFIRAIRDGKADTLPGTVLAMLQARIGRLAAASQQSLLAASVFGPTFWAGGVRALLADDDRDSDVDADLRDLLAGELIERHSGSRFSGETEYAFRHALMREAAYSLLGDDQRAASHRLAGDFLESLGEADPMVIGEHFRAAGQFGRAVPYFVRGAVQAFDSNDFSETLARVATGLACDPLGEGLGILLGLQCNTFFWVNDLEASYGAGMRALPLLQPGSRHWANTMIGLLNATLVLPQSAEVFPELVARVMATPPTAAGAVAHAEALSFVVITTTGGGQRALADACLLAMQKLGTGDAPDLQIDASIKHAAVFHSLLLAADPWQTRTLACELLAVAEAIGVYRLVGMARCYLGLVDLQLTGTTGEATVRDGLALMRHRKELLNELFFAAMLVAHTADRCDADTVDELERTTTRLVSEAAANPFVGGWGHAALAWVHLYRGQLDAAEAATRRADERLRSINPPYMFVLECGIRVALARGDVASARARAESALRTITAMAGGGPCEVKVRTAAADAFLASGDSARATTERALALQQLHLRADRIPDPAARRRYLELAPASLHASS